jgi:hypothetical protein
MKGLIHIAAACSHEVQKVRAGKCIIIEFIDNSFERTANARKRSAKYFVTVFSQNIFLILSASWKDYHQFGLIFKELFSLFQRKKLRSL